MKLFLQKIFPVLLLLIVGTATLELLAYFQMLPNYLFPAPSLIFKSFLENQTALWNASLQTFFNSFLGWFFASLLGFTLALLFTWNSYLYRAFFPVAILFQTVPIVAIAPLLVIWFGFGNPTVRASSLIVAFFPVLASTMMGLSETPRELQELFRSFNSSRFQEFLFLKIPNSVPYIYAGLKTSAGLAVVGAIIGEFVAGGGLGAVIDSAKAQQNLELVFAAILISTLLGVFFVLLLQGLQLLLLRWRPFFAAKN